VRVADCSYNLQQMLNLIAQAEEERAAVVCLPELSITAYTCQDLFRQQVLLDGAEQAVKDLLSYSTGTETIIIVGTPVRYACTVLDCAAVIQNGKLLGLVSKKHLASHDGFSENRWFTSIEEVPEGRICFAGQQTDLCASQIFRTPHFTFGVEIGHDLWSPIPASTKLCLRGAEIIFNLSADNAQSGKDAYIQQLAAQQSARCHAAYVLSGCGYGESTQDMVFPGRALIFENGKLLAQGKKFGIEPQLICTEIDVECIRNMRRNNKTFTSSSAVYRTENVKETQIDKIIEFSAKESRLTRPVDAQPFIPQGALLDERCEEIFRIQALGLARRVEHTRAKSMVIGISGGLDSTLALLVCAQACDMLQMPRQTIVGVTMPGFGTTDRTYTNALELMKGLGITMREIPIREACLQHFSDIGHDVSVHDVTYENSQARERTQILMDVANQSSGFVVGTGDLSELALGWATYNGDHMSMYGVNASVPKTFVRHLVTWIAGQEAYKSVRAALLDIVDTPISPELIPADEAGNIKQKTEDLVGPYELHDFFLYNLLRLGFGPAKVMYLARHAFDGQYTDDMIRHWLQTFCRRFFQQQFKRSCLPDGPKVGSCSLSPRGDWQMPSDAMGTLWHEQAADR
ncbi:MAG: NAD(+) synthase, partial [Bacteroidaceae bacterium]|nr:NAD(+) synthase [Bacteroidaceae bacterium]